MKKIIWIIVGVVIFGLVIFKLAINKKTSESNVYQIDKEKPVLVSVDTIQLIKINEDEVFTGTFEPNKEVNISAETQGKITSFLVGIGSHVRKGQTIIQIDNSLLQLQLESVEVQIEGLQDDLNRFTILTEADAIEGIKLEKAQLGLKAAQVQKATLLEQIRKTSIRAPFSGIVTAKLSEIGAFAAPGVPLLQITDISTLKFTVNVPENDLKQFKAEPNFIISADAFPDIALNGKLSMIGSKTNMGNSFPIQFQVSNTTDLDIKSGMFGKLELFTSETKQGILIPSSAIINNEDKTQVYWVRNGKAVLKSITVSKNIGNQVLVSEGLDLGDVIVTNGFINLFEGANIKVK